jgi:nanoRNase/pAp phosphatase (c-di-AMP/oligoRNAs hydrolase)
MILITSYVNPDLDGTACAVAMEELLRSQGQEAQAVIFGTPSLEARWLLETCDILSPPDGSDLLRGEVSVMLVDVSDPNEINEVFDPLTRHRNH